MAGAKKKRVTAVVPGVRNPSGVAAFSTKGVRKPVRATYYGKKAR